MNEALQFLYQIYDSFVSLVFDGLELFPNVTIGWIAITIFVFNILFKNILALPNKSSSVRISRGDKKNE